MLPLLTQRLQAMDPSLVPEAIRNSLRESQRAHTAFALRLTAELFRILERLAEAGIEILVTKGPVLSVRCYGDPGMRQYGDLDLVVRHLDIQRSTQTMLDLGYAAKVPVRAIEAQKIPGEYAFRKSDNQILVELHTERTFRYHPRRLNIEQLFYRQASVVVDGRGVPALSVEDELVLISIHGSKHFWERLMWIADVAALISSGTINWNRAIEIAREVSAERILRLALRLAADVLGAKLPSPLEAEIRSNRAVGRLANYDCRFLPQKMIGFRGANTHAPGLSTPSEDLFAWRESTGEERRLEAPGSIGSIENRTISVLKKGPGKKCPDLFPHPSC